VSSTSSAFQVIRLAGELDMVRRDEIRSALMLAPTSRAILVDLTEVSYADSTVLAELLRFRNEADAANRRIAVLIGDARFARVLQYAGLGDAFAIFAERGLALTFLAGSGA
jgi:anti-sigma B factor antagonist